MDSIDKKILNMIQRNFPLVAAPFQAVAEQVGIPEDEVIDRIGKMKQAGVIRRLGAVFDSRELGCVSTLGAARAPEEKLKAFGEAVNAYPGVTHNYRRNHDFNVWFTFIAPDQETLEKSLADIRTKTGVADIISMPAARTFKIDASFELE
jgi:DNA-binding Lrp family transcriptional regulator